MTPNCRTTIELLAGYVDGALSPEEEAVLREHMAQCPRCVEFLASYRGTSRIFRDATDVDVPPDLEARLLDLLRSQGLR